MVAGHELTDDRFSKQFFKCCFALTRHFLPLGYLRHAFSCTDMLPADVAPPRPMTSVGYMCLALGNGLSGAGCAGGSGRLVAIVVAVPFFIPA